MNDTKPSPFGTRRTQIAIAAILVVGALSAALILRSGQIAAALKVPEVRGTQKPLATQTQNITARSKAVITKMKKDMQMVSTMMKKSKRTEPSLQRRKAPKVLMMTMKV